MIYRQPKYKGFFKIGSCLCNLRSHWCEKWCLGWHGEKMLSLFFCTFLNGGLLACDSQFSICWLENQAELLAFSVSATLLRK